MFVVERVHVKRTRGKSNQIHVVERVDTLGGGANACG